MRKSTVMIMAILMLCFGTLLIAASVLAKPMKQDALLGKELTRLLAYREVIEEGSTVSVVRRPAQKDKTLAAEGRGVIVELTPARKISKRRGGVSAVLSQVVSQVRDTYADTRLDWIEFHLLPADPGKKGAKPVRTLVRRTATGFGPPKPSVG